MAVDWVRLTALVDEALAKQRTKLGKINIIVAGHTGVGKSTLVNAVFGREFALTAEGRPVTRHAVGTNATTTRCASLTPGVSKPPPTRKPGPP